MENIKETLNKFDNQDSITYLNDKIKNALDSPTFIRKKKQFSELKKEIVLDSIRGGRNNINLYSVFKTLVKNKKYFDLEHVNALGLDYDILIFLSKKGIGKSYHMVQQLNKWVEDGTGITVVFRLFDEHLPALAQQLEDYGATFTMGSNGKFSSLKQFEPDIKNPSKQVPRYVGRACGMKTAHKLKGGGYKNLKGIIFDECTDKADGITKDNFETFFVSILNSLERESRIPLIMFGNTDGCESQHPLFSCLGIDPTENLVYIKRQFGRAKNPSRILYINSRELYEAGAEHSVMIGAIADPHKVVSAFFNESIMKTKKICSLDLTAVTTPLFGILFTDLQNEKILIKTTYFDTTNPDNIEEKIRAYFISAEKYDPMFTYGFNVFTSEDVLHSLYVEHTYYVEELEDYWEFLMDIMHTKYCLFVGSDTELILTRYLKKFAKSKTI